MNKTEDIKKEKSALEARAVSKQALASDPKLCVWVEASAGTGKTKVLSDRVLRLLLEGVEPSKILCLTYTKAAAVEMNNRIYSRLSKWAVEPQGDLEDEIKTLYGNHFVLEKNSELTDVARTLFARVLDAPAPIKIQTIHSFCEEILKRFPLEANVSPYFEVMDERTTDEALSQISKHVLQEAQSAVSEEISDAVMFLTANMKEFGFEELLADLTGQRSKLMRVISAFSGTDQFLETLRKKLKLEENPSKEGVLRRFEKGIDRGLMKKCVLALLEGSKKDKEHGTYLADALEKFDFEIYRKAFLTQNGDILSTLAYKDSVKAMGNIIEVMSLEAVRVKFALEEMKSVRLYETTRAVFVLAKRLIDEYGEYKRKNARMDYEDLIVLTKNLLESKDVASWVFFKLDEGVEHILIDEAQDTSPNQWAIVKALTDEFFSGLGQSSKQRTVFAVGDRKQSIYRFQGAEPERFDQMRHFYKGVIADFETVHLDVSFRSTGAVLDFVNDLFSIEGADKGLVDGEEKVFHLPYRIGDAGKVELWALSQEENEDKDQDKGWTLPIYAKHKESAQTKMAVKIAREIKNLVESKEILASKGRPLRYKDFMVLVQRRSGFVDDFVKACKQNGVEISGVDKLKLNEQIAVQDLISLAKFLLLPADDLSLAEVLKSPLFGLNDDDLFDLCYDRGSSSLWQRLNANSKYGAECAFLAELLALSDLKRPYELFGAILYEFKGKKKFLARLGSEASDALDEFMNLTLEFEVDHVPNLQNFVRWIGQTKIEVKREMEQMTQDAVRIMTVHGSKGLQSPVVILPDTVREPWMNKGKGIVFDENVVYFPLCGDDYDLNCEAVFEQEKNKAYDEYRRLLYVALTRAEDRLYICGYGKPKKDDKSWYGLCVQTMENRGLKEEKGKIVCKTEQFADVEVKLKKEAKIKERDSSFVYHLPPAESPMSKPYSPSHMQDEDDQPVASPLTDEGFFYKRGLIIHKLLQMLPNKSSGQDRKKLIEEYLSGQADLSEKYRKDILEEVSQLLEDPRFSFVFGENSRAEVPVMGEVEGKIISGQIDRLVVFDDRVVIVDFKTNRPAASERSEVAEQYVKQMDVYRKLLEKVYEGRAVETYILWTNTLKLMKI